MTDRSGFTKKHSPDRRELWRRARSAMLTEARMVAVWLRASVSMTLEPMVRFILGPAVVPPPGQFPRLASISEELGAIAQPKKSAVRPSEPFAIRAVRPSPGPGRVDRLPPRRTLKIFHAARHAGNEP